MPDAVPSATPAVSPPSRAASASTVSPSARPGTNSATGWPFSSVPATALDGAAGISRTLNLIIRPAVVTAPIVARAVVASDVTAMSPALKGWGVGE